MDEYPLIPLLEHLSHSSPDGARSIMSRGEEGGEEAGILKPEATGGGESTPDPSEALSDDDADKKKNIIVVQGGEPGSGAKVPGFVAWLRRAPLPPWPPAARGQPR